MATISKVVIGDKSALKNRLSPCRSRAFGVHATGARSGFSLVEVVIALAVMASAFLVVFGLLGVGMTTFHQSKAITVSSQIAQQVYSELEVIPFGNLVGAAGLPTNRAAYIASGPSAPSYTDSYTDGNNTVQRLYFDEQGNELGTGSSTSTPPAGTIYWVNVSIMYPTPMNPASTSSNNTAANVDLATVLVQVAYNPAGLTPTVDNDYKWTGTVQATNAAMQIANYQFYVNRNS